MSGLFTQRRILALALLTALCGSVTGTLTQTPSLPSESLTLGVFTIEFRADGTFAAAASIEGMGASRATAQWKTQGDIVELADWNSKGELLEPTTGCDVAGRYRFAVERGYVRFELATDDCLPRRTLFDGIRWRSATAPETVVERRITRTLAKPRPPIPRASDAVGSWPSFRGPQASGVADGQRLPDHWNGETRENMLWKTPIPGLGHSSPIVWGDRLFVTSAISSRYGATLEPARFEDDGGASGDRSRHRWMLYALDRRTGQIIWARMVHEGEPIDKRHIRSTYATATAATDGRIVVTWFGSQGVHAYTVTGDFLWKVELGRVNAGARAYPPIEWGPASSPIIWDDLVILQVDTQTDAFVVALRLETGEQVWKTGRDEGPSWTTPTVVSTADGPELLTSAATYARGYDPRTGAERWRLRGGGDSIIPVPTPIFGEGVFVFASSGVADRRPLVAVRPGGRGDLSLKENETSNAFVVWSRAGRGSGNATPLTYRGLLYVLTRNGILDAYDPKIGEEMYRQRLSAIGSGFSASPVAADGKIYLANEDGEILVVSAGLKFRHIATNPMGEVIMATPALSGDVMYVRGLHSLFAVGGKE